MAGKYVPHVGDKVKVRDDADSFSVGLFYRRGDVGFVKETDGVLDILVLFDHGEWHVSPHEIELIANK